MSLNKAFIFILLRLLSKLSLKSINKLGIVLGSILNLTPNKHKKITLINLRLAFPELEEEEIIGLCKKSLIETSITLLESGYVWIKLPGSNLPLSIQTRGFEHILKSAEEEQGLIVFTPHQANIEVLINYLGQQIDCCVPYSEIKNKYLNSYVKNARAKMGVRMVKDDISGVKVLLKNLKEGRAVAIASDQVPELSGGELSKFFEQDCLSMTLISKLHQKTNAKIHSMVCIREANGKGFKLIFSPQLNMPPTTKEGVDTMNKELEKCIMLAPEQYAWEYKKYRRAGNENIYN